MLGLGWTEMLVIGVMALIFIGPKDLPVVMGRIGKVIGQVQRMGREFQREINKTTGLDEVRNLRNTITAPLKQTADEIRKDFNAIGKDGKESPTGALKPTDPKTESVVEAIQQQAGMPAAKKSNDELATDYGFKSTKTDTAAAKPAKAEPVKAARSKTATAKTGSPTTAAAKPKSASKPKSTTDKSAPKTEAVETAKPARKAAAPKTAVPKTADATPAAAKSSAAKPAATKAAKAPAASAEDKPAPKRRAPRKQPADPAGKSE